MRPLTVGSLFSGVGGFEMGFERAGFVTRWQCEIDPDATSVLERHWPNVRRYRDVTEVDPADLEPVDVIAFGSPCQGFSVAGKGNGLKDERSGLFGEALRIIRGVRPAIALWENVPGAFSTGGDDEQDTTIRGRDFAAVLAGLANLGAVDIGWRVLDAQYFGVPQRRRRIFLVADFRGRRTAQILLESDSGGGDLDQGSATREDASAAVTDGAGDAGLIYDQQNCLVGPATVCGTLQAGGLERQNRGFVLAMAAPWDEAQITSAVNRSRVEPGMPAPTLNGSGLASVVAWQESQSGVRERGDLYGTLDANYGPRRHEGVMVNPPVAFDWTVGTGNPCVSEAVTPALQACKTPAVAISENQRAECRETPYVYSLTDGGGKPGQGYPCIRDGTILRRLTPVECERLMGWPDDHTRWRGGGREISDGPRYRMCGNGVVANVAEWLARRLHAALEAS